MLFRRLGARERGRVPHMVEPQLQPPNKGRASGRLRQSRMLLSSEPPMPRTFYIWTRDLHLYLGLLVSPFLILFAVSVFYVNHVHLNPAKVETSTREVRELAIPEGITVTEGMEQALLARKILPQVGLDGEINFIRNLRSEEKLVIPVVGPGFSASIDLRLPERTATVTERQTSLAETFAYLHRSPGPHNVAIRGNWFWTTVWRWLADATVYLVLFISISGVYMWTALGAERRVGLALLGAGALTFLGVFYAVVG